MTAETPKADETAEEMAEELGLKNELLEKFLEKWDRGIAKEKRCYGIKLCFAGAESKKVRDGLHRIGVQHILVSYFYLQKWLEKTPYQEVAEDLGRFDFVFLDSGGFTFLDALRQGKKLKYDIREYADKYYEELPKYGSLFSGCAEVDVEELGDDYMTAKKLAMLEQNVPIVPVIQGYKLSTYESYGWFEDYPYIAVGSALLGNPKFIQYMSQLYQKCDEKGVILHGFGATSANTILRSRFYSVDSTSWTGGSRYGTTMLFQNGRIRHYDNKHKEVRKRYKNRFEENGIIWSDIEADKGFEVDMMNALAWKQWADYIKYSAIKCYWLNSEEQDEALKLKSKAFNTEGLIDRKVSIERAAMRRLTHVEDADYDDRAHEVLHCDTCYMTGKCPRHKPGQPCGYDINIRFETKSDQKFLGLIQQVRDIYDPREELKITAKGGSGTIANALAAVFQPTGAGTSGSGSTPTVLRLKEQRGKW